MTTNSQIPYVYIVRSSVPDAALPIEVERECELPSIKLRVANSQGSKVARVRYLEKLHVGPDSLGGEIEQEFAKGEQPLVVVDNVIKASRIAQVMDHLNVIKDKTVISVSGLSGAGKSEFSSILASYLKETGLNPYILSLDNYYHRVANDNAEYRSSLLSQSEDALAGYLGSEQEIDLARVSNIVSEFKEGAKSITLRQMNLRESIIADDRLEVSFKDIDVLILEGTWSLSVDDVDVRILLASRPDLTLLRRVKRGRDPITPETERAILLEQRRLSTLRESIDLEIYDDYFIEFPSGRLRNVADSEIDGQGKSLSRLLAVQHREVSVGSSRLSKTIQTESVAPYCPIPAVSGSDATSKAVESLHEMTVPQGLLASSAKIANYRRVWARDSVITGLGGMLAGDDKVTDGLRCSLNLLAENAGPDGQIPSNVSVANDGSLKAVSYGGLAGRVDTIPWYIIGVCQYALTTGNREFFDSHLKTITAALDLLKVWEFNGRGLVYMPQAGDWADEYIYSGYALLPQVLRLWAMQCVAEMTSNDDLNSEAARLRTLLEVNFWPLAENIDHELIYHEHAFSSFINDREPATYFEACLSPTGYSRQLDFLGNSLACLLRLGSDEQRRSIMGSGQLVVKNLQMQLCPAFWPPVFETDPEWSLLWLSFRDTFRNEPFRYHNGGTWPMVSGWWGAALLSEGHKDEATEILNSLYVANSLGVDGDEWGFTECFHSISGQPDGVTPCAWSAASPLFLKSQIEGLAELSLFNPA